MLLYGKRTRAHANHENQERSRFSYAFIIIYLFSAIRDKFYGDEM